MEKTAENPSGAPRRRRRRRGSGGGASQNPQVNPARETGKTSQPAAKEKTSRQPGRKESKEAMSAAPASRGRHRGGAQGETAQQAAPAGRRTRGGNGGQQATAKEQNHAQKPSSRAARSQRKAMDEDPGLELIARRPPKQKFANFEEYLAAHGGMTVPLPEEEPSPAAEGAAE